MAKPEECESRAHPALWRCGKRRRLPMRDYRNGDAPVAAETRRGRRVPKVPRSQWIRLIQRGSEGREVFGRRSSNHFNHGWTRMDTDKDTTGRFAVKKAQKAQKPSLPFFARTLRSAIRRPLGIYSGTDKAEGCSQFRPWAKPISGFPIRVYPCPSVVKNQPWLQTTRRGRRVPRVQKWRSARDGSSFTIADHRELRGLKRAPIRRHAAALLLRRPFTNAQLLST